MDIKQPGNTQTGGVFDFGAAPEAAKDAATVETETTTQEGTTEDTTVTSNANDTTQETQTQETPATETTDGSEQETDPQKTQQTVTETPFEIDGRTFASKAELVTAYKNSSTEGVRLSKLTKEYELKLAEREAKLLEMEAKQFDAPFPGALSADAEQEEAQLAMMPQHRQTEYILAKREWAQKQAQAKQEHAQRLQQSTEQQKHIKEVIEQSTKEMEGKPEEYPNFKELTPTMQKIVELSPALANRPETPYLSFWIAYGLNAYNKERALKTETEKAAATTKEKAKSAQTQLGKSGNGKTTTATPGNSSPIVSAWRDRNGVGL
jgi:hypothetical protein